MPLYLSKKQTQKVLWGIAANLLLFTNSPFLLDRILGQYRAIRQEGSGRIFAPIQSLENEGILYVFLVFQTEEVGQKGGGDSQTQLCGVALV